MLERIQNLVLDYDTTTHQVRCTVRKSDLQKKSTIIYLITTTLSSTLLYPNRLATGVLD